MDIISSDIFVTIFSLTIALYAIVLFFYFKVKGDFSYREEKGDKKKFYRALKSGLMSGTIESLNDIENIYKGIKRESLEGFTYQKYLNIWLREFNLDLISKNLILQEDKEVEFKLDDDILVKQHKHLIDGFIKELDEKAPFAELQDAERNLLNDVSLITINHEPEKNLIKPKLLELAGLIKVRDDDLNWQKKLNKITILTTIVGLILTLIFGFLSLRN